MLMKGQLLNDITIIAWLPVTIFIRINDKKKKYIFYFLPILTKVCN